MPWCPKCGAEYVENVRKCRDCGVGLLDHKPTPDEMLPPDPKPTGWRRFVTRERFLRVLKTLIAILLALAAALSLQGCRCKKENGTNPFSFCAVWVIFACAGRGA